MKNYSIHWFRRDLRIPGNDALRQNWKSTDRRVLGLFCFDSSFLKRADFSNHRFAFFLKTLKQLKTELTKQGGDLLVVDQLPADFFSTLFAKLKQNQLAFPQTISFCKDYEPFARERDQKMTELFTTHGVNVIQARDHLLVEPTEILKDDGSFYQVYSPYSRRWFEFLSSKEGQSRISSQKNMTTYYQNLKNDTFDQELFGAKWSELGINLPDDSLESFEKENNLQVKINIPDAGFRAAYERLDKFSEQLGSYNSKRDFPSIDGTSLMSLYLKNGSMTSSQILHKLQLNSFDFKSKSESNQYIKEIAWREFYYSILYHRPDCEKSTFLKQYSELKWENNKDWFRHWCEGQTGFPIVDAGMRQLNTTGWMHNRVRMIVASFLVKDLLINWQWGENYFMKMLLDGDLAPNNGGWQWAASTGCDPQPYFRVFNPWLQGAKFDPEAKYIKKFVPELNDIDATTIHDPEGHRGRIYPAPIVDHKIQKERAILLFKTAK